MKRYFAGNLIFLALFTAAWAHPATSDRTDQQIATDVQNKINADTNFPDKGLNVSVANGIVTLSGNISSEAARNAAANDAAQVEGVRVVVNNLRVAPPNSDPPPQSQPEQSQSQPPQSQAPQGQPQDQDSNNPPGMDSPPASPSEAQTVTVPAGTLLSIRLNEELSSEKAQVGDLFRGSISTPVRVDDTTVIPTSADVEGRVVDVKPAARFAGKSDLVIELTGLLMNGKNYPLATDRWSKSGSSRGKETAGKVGGGAVVGAIIGGIFGGGKGAAIGAATGAGVGTGVSASGKGQQVVLEPETMLTFQMESSITVVPGVSRQPMTDDRDK